MGFVFFKMYLFYMCVCLNLCMSAICLPGACRGQRRALDSLEMELTDSYEPHHVGAGMVLEEQPVLLTNC